MQVGIRRDLDRRVRVCIAAPYFHPYYSGLAERFRGYLPGLKARGMDLTIVTGTPDAARKSATYAEERWRNVPLGGFLPEDEVSGVPVYRVRIPNQMGYSREETFGKGVVRYCRSLHRPDVVQLFSIGRAMIPALRQLRRLGLPVVSTQTIMPPVSSSVPRRMVRRLSLGVSSRLVDCLVVSTGVMAQALREAGARTRIDIIGNGVSTRIFRPATGPDELMRIRQLVGLPLDAKVILFVGAVTPRKRVDLLLEAWGVLANTDPDLHLVVAGPRLDKDDPDLKAFNRRIEELIDLSGGRSRIHFTGFTDSVPELMRAADLFLFTSEREGWGNVIPEAMASGLPVVTTSFLGFPSEFGQPGRHFVMSLPNSREIAESVARLLGSPESRRVIAREAFQWVKKTLDLKRSLDLYAELYRDLSECPDIGARQLKDTTGPK